MDPYQLQLLKLPALCPSEQAARASAVGRSRCQQLNGVVQQADKNLDSICVKVESEEVDARIRAVRHNRCRVPLRLALTKVLLARCRCLRDSWPCEGSALWLPKRRVLPYKYEATPALPLVAAHSRRALRA